MLSDAFLQFEQEEKEREALEEGENNSSNNNNDNNDNTTQNNTRKLFESKKENKEANLRLLKETWYHRFIIYITIILPTEVFFLSCKLLLWYLFFL